MMRKPVVGDGVPEGASVDSVKVRFLSRSPHRWTRSRYQRARERTPRLGVGRTPADNLRRVSLRGVMTGTLLRRRPRIYLHIGAMKTGTTYLQDLMAANKENLA